jgi:hypothetical protein
LPPLPGSGRGRLPKLLRRDGEHPVSVKTLAHELPPEAWHNITRREGSADWLASRFARLRVRPAHRDTWRAEPRAEEWLLIEWPQGEPEPTKCWLSTMPVNQHRTGTPRRFRISTWYSTSKRQFGGVPIGADRDPTLQANSADRSKVCSRYGRGPTSVLIYNRESRCGSWVPETGNLTNPAAAVGDPSARIAQLVSL